MNGKLEKRLQTELLTEDTVFGDASERALVAFVAAVAIRVDGAFSVVLCSLGLRVGGTT